jgi:hypothetical protein
MYEFRYEYFVIEDEEITVQNDTTMVMKIYINYLSFDHLIPINGSRELV